MTQVESERLVGPEPERGLLLAVLAKGADDEQELAELRELARAAGVNPVGQLVQHRAQPDRRSYVGKGKLEELKGGVRRGARRGVCSSTTSSSRPSRESSRTRFPHAWSTGRS